MNIDNEILLERFATAELTSQEESELLVRCECEPELWRAAVLSMIEHRTLTQALQTGPANTTSSNQHHRCLRSVAWTACALLLGIALGHFSIPNQRENGLLATTETAQIDKQISQTPETSLTSTLPVSFQIDPIAFLTEVDHWAAKPIFPKETVAELNETGIEVSEETELFVYDTIDGERLILPVCNATFKLNSSP